ncbi:MAG: ABC transporter substrate-binding protein, partial [Nocardioidaceae bacterium]|nr:ABC transporter substrate-binding protein [Nocardioidaceae bacterium]
MKRPPRLVTALTVAAAAIALASCAPPKDDNSSSPDAKNTGASSGQSAEDYLADLVTKAEEEGELNVIALPPDWANYGNVIAAFEEKYDITVNSDQP